MSIRALMSKAVLVPTCDPLDIDLIIFSYWLKGCTSEAATRGRLQHEPNVAQGFGEDLSFLLLTETEEMFRLFNTIEVYLQNPPTFLNQMVFQVCVSLSGRVINRN